MTIRLKTISLQFTFALLATITFDALSIQAIAQDVSVYVLRNDGGSSRKSGAVSSITPDGLTLDGEQIPAEKIRKIAISREPSEIDRARDQMVAGRYADSLEELNKIDPPPTNPLLIQEIEFIRAYSTAQQCLGEGTIAPVEAGRVVKAFLDQYDQSFHVYPLLEQYGKLILAFGKPDLAAQQFQKLQQAQWTQYRLTGYFMYGRMMELTDQLNAAQTAYQAILQESGTDDATQLYQSLAKAELAKLNGLTGDPAQALAELNEMVKQGNSDNQLLFGYLNNAKAMVHLKAGNLKAARNNFMKTQLLCGTASQPHAEAMYRLANLWPQLEDTDRANEAREILKTRYRNSYWSQLK